MSANKRNRLRLLGVMVLAALLVTTLGLDVALRAHDARLKMASLEQLKAIGAVLHSPGGRRAEMGEVPDPRSGRALELLAVTPEADGSLAPCTPLACFPVSAAPGRWWFDLYGHDTRGGSVLFADGHAEWLPEADYRSTIHAARPGE